MAQNITFTPTQTPPNSPCLRPKQPYIDDLRNVLVEIHKSITKLPETTIVKANSGSTSAFAAGAATVQPEQPKGRASRLEFKKIKEV